MRGRWIVAGIGLLAASCQFGSQTDGSGDGSGESGADDDGGSTGGPIGTAGDATSSADGGTGGPTTGCADANGGCDPNATCDDTSGEVVCTCNTGFSGNGFACEPEMISLRRLHYENPCTATLTVDCPWENFCEMADVATDSATFSGEAGQTYGVTLRFRGVISQIYIEGGMTDGYWNEGGTPMPSNPFQPVTLDISDPPQSYYLNAGPDQAEYCVAMDYTREVRMAAGAEVTIGHYDTNACSVINRDEQGMPLEIQGVDVQNQPYDGQFLQVDFVSARIQG